MATSPQFSQGSRMLGACEFGSRRFLRYTHSSDYGLSDKTAGQPFCAAEELPAGRSAWMHFVQQQARRAHKRPYQ